MNRPEQSLQRSVVRLLETALPAGWLVTALRGNPRSRVAGAIERSMGAKAGLPDLAIMGRVDDEPRIWFVELKTRTGRTSAVQVAMHDRLRDIGFPVDTLRSLDDVQQWARAWALPWRAGL